MMTEQYDPKQDLQLTERRRTYHNTKTATSLIARRVLESGIHLDERFKHELEFAWAFGRQCSDIHIELNRAGLKCDVYVRPVGQFSAASRGYATDDAGNEFIPYSLEFKTNWSAIGSSSPAVTLTYARLLQDAATLCAELEAEFGDTKIYECVSTAAGREKAARERSERQETAARAAIVNRFRKHMRVGQKKNLPDGGLANKELSTGTTVHKFNDGKTYKVTISSDDVTALRATIERIA